MLRKEKYPMILQMIKEYEYKFKKQMFYVTLIDYIQSAYKFSKKTAEEYGEDLRHMNYITVQTDGRVLRVR